MKDFNVGWILQKVGEDKGFDVVTEGIDDRCFGMTVTADKSVKQIFQENSGIYNYQIIDGDPIRLVRRKVNDDLVIDFEINETDDDCIRRAPAPTIAFQRVDPRSLPRSVEVQYSDPDRGYAMTPQLATYPGAPRSNPPISIAIDFVISAQQARDLAFDLLYRLWAQQLGVNFEHKDLSIEPGDTIELTCSKGVFILLVIKNTINMPARTNSIFATVLLSSRGQTIAAQGADPFRVSDISILTADDAEWITADGERIITQG